MRFSVTEVRTSSCHSLLVWQLSREEDFCSVAPDFIFGALFIYDLLKCKLFLVFPFICSLLVISKEVHAEILTLIIHILYVS